MMRSVTQTIWRWALLALAAALGLAVGTVGALEHRAAVSLGAVAWPYGLLLALCGLAGLLLGLGELGAAAAGSWRPTRLAAVGWAAAGWVVAVLWLTYFGPPFSGARKGDVVLADDWRSLLYLICGMALATAAVYRAWVAALATRIAAYPNAEPAETVHPKR